MNTETKTPLEQWIEETKKKNLSLKDLENYIRNSLSCPYELYCKLPGLDSQNKAEILFNEWKNEPKPIEKWSVGSYVVFLKDIKGVKAGYVDIITKKVDDTTVYLEEYLTLCTSRESKGEIKWFATEAEAEVFAETLIPNKVKNKFTVGTWYKLDNWISKFHHIEEDYRFYGENINTDSGYLDPLGWLSLFDYTPIELSIEEVQQYLPDGHPDKTFVLPEKWCIKVTHENKDILSKWRTSECLSDNNGYCLNKHVLVPGIIGYWVKEKPEDYTEITMEQFNSLIKSKKPIKQAVNCETQEQWDFVTEKLGYKWEAGRWEDYKADSKISLDSQEYGKSYECYYSFQEWCNLNDFKMSKTERDWSRASIEELIAKAKKNYPIGTKFIPAYASQNFDYFCIICTTDFRYENDCLYAVLPDNTVYDIQNNPEYGSCSLNRVIFYSKEWATILPAESKPQFEVGKWYQIKTAYDWIIKYKGTNNGKIEAAWSCLAKSNTKVGEGGNWGSKPTEVKELSIEEVQQYLPDNHPDKIKPNQKFKIGDWVVWRDGYIDTIKRHCNSFADSWYLSKRYNSCSELALRHATQDEINKHLISIEQIPAGEPLNTGIEPNKDGMFKYTTVPGTSFGSNYSSAISYLNSSSKPKMILSIDDEELPMVDIIKTKSTQILNNY